MCLSVSKFLKWVSCCCREWVIVVVSVYVRDLWRLALFYFGPQCSVSERANGQAIGPVSQSGFLFILDHSAFVSVSLPFFLSSLFVVPHIYFSFRFNSFWMMKFGPRGIPSGSNTDTDTSIVARVVAQIVTHTVTHPNTHSSTHTHTHTHTC